MKILNLCLASFFIFSSVLAADKTCLIPERVTKATRVGVTPAVTVDFYPGEELALVSEKNKRVVFSVGDLRYTVPNLKNFQRRKKTACGTKTCVKLTSKAQYYKSPNEFDKARPIADGIYPAVTLSDGWARVQTNETFVWIRRSQVKSSKIACDAVMTTEVSEATTLGPREDKYDVPGADISRYRWRYGFEGGWIQDVSAKPLKNLLSGVPSGTTNVNTDSYDSPIIEETSDGAGWYAGATLEAFLGWNLKAKWSLGYKVRTIDYISRSNPFVPGGVPVQYDQLDRDVVTQDFGFVYLGTFVKHQGWKRWGLLWQPGINLSADFALDKFSQEFQTAPNKLNTYTLDSGYDSIEFIYGPRIDITYGVFVFSAAANFTAYELEPTLGAGFLF